MTKQEEAADLCKRRHELTVANLLGALCENGEEEVLAALLEATAEFYAWKAEHAPRHVPMFVRMKILSELTR